MTFVVWEHKTSGEDIGETSVYWRRLQLDPQISLYLQAAGYLGYPSQSCSYDVLAKPKLQPLMATPIASRKYTIAKKDKPSRLYADQRDIDETPDEYEARILAAIAEDPNKFYQRGVPIVRLEKEAEEAQFDVWHTAENIRESMAYNIWPRNPDACILWGRPCSFLDICCGQADANDPARFGRRPRMHEELSDQAPSKRHLTLLTQSSIRTYRSCPRKYFLRYVELLYPMARTPGPLRIGTSLHRMLEVWWGNGGNLTMALAANETTDLYDRAKERAMMIGYHARWPAPMRVVAVEREFRMPLFNPATGHASRTFELGGKLDVITEAA